MTDKPIVFKADKVDIIPSRKTKFTNLEFPTSYEITGTFTASDELLKWATQNTPKPQEVLDEVSSLMKKFEIPKERVVSDRDTLKWLFLNK